MSEELFLQNMIIDRIKKMTKTRLIQLDTITKTIEDSDDIYNTDFVKSVLESFEEEGAIEYTAEFKKELFGE